MEKINIGQRFETTKDTQLIAGISEKASTIKKGTALFAGADKRFWYMLNGKMILIDKDCYEVSDGFSVTGLAEWIYQHISRSWSIDEMLEEQADYEETGLSEQVKAFKESIGEALEELGFYDYAGNTI